jgi:hypothetical protein
VHCRQRRFPLFMRILAKPHHNSKINSPPVFWTEVYSRPDGRWLCVNPVSANVDRSRTFEPTSSDEFNHMLYVVAFEEGEMNSMIVYCIE